LWISIESVFSNPSTVKEMPAEAKRFSRVDKSWIKSQKQSFDMKSVLQCCLGSSVQENTKRVLLKDIQKELEICFKSLNSYLEKKRRSFPRYYFLSNSALLTLLSYTNNTGNVSALKSYFTSLFSCLSNLKLEELKEKEEERISSTSSASFSDKPKSALQTSETPSFFRNPTEKTLTLSHSEWEISECYTLDGEVLTLFRRINLEKGAESWIPKLKDSISDTLKRFVSGSLTDVNANMSTEELAYKYPAQVCLIALNYMWTKEAEASILELKNERKTVNLGSKKFSQISAKLYTLLSKTKWTNLDKPILPFHKLRLEAMITVSSFYYLSFCFTVRNNFFIIL